MPDAETLKVTDWPTPTVAFCGWLPIAGSNEQITADAEAYCTRYSTKFFGLMFPKRPLPGTTLENLKLDLCYTPIPDEDEAHTDLTFTGPIPAGGTEEHEKKQASHVFIAP